jgi:hypothetical protein
MPQPIGPTLREARIRRQLDLPAVEAETKIRVRYLRALENEEWDVLPGGAYTRSFIRTYAVYLGLDGERLVDEYRREREAAHGDRDAPAEPRSRGRGRGQGPPGPGGGGSRGLSPGAITAVIAVLLIGVLVAIGVAGGGGEDEPGDARTGPREAQSREGAPGQSREKPPGIVLRLDAEADVWVCLVNAGGRQLLDGQTLTAGQVEGPFRSRSFTVTLGNGAVGLEVDGSPLAVEQTPNPVGFRITRAGAAPLAEGERPTCT